jgi:cation diffusion facilitator family transporter
VSKPRKLNHAVLWALAANLLIAAAKFAGAFFSQSASLLAEAVHSLVDSGNQALLIVGNRRAAHPPTKRHPLGHSREAFFWSFIVAILLFSLGGMFAIYEGAHRLSSHEPPTQPLLAGGILLVGILAEGASFLKCLREIRKKNSHANLWQWYRRTAAADLLVIFTEDSAALVGLLLAGIALGLTWLTGNPVWDALGSIAIGAILVSVAVILAIETKSLLIGEAPTTDFRTFLDQEVPRHLPGARILRLIAVQIGPSEVVLSYKVSPGAVGEVKRLIDGINALERAVRARFPTVAWQFVEPDFEA